MAVTKIRKMSSWTLLVVSLISIVVLGMFFGGGITNPGEEMKEYVYTGLLLNWTTGLFFVTIVCMVLFAIWQFVNLLKVNPKSAVAALGVVVAFVAMLFITYSIGDGTPLQGLNADSQKYNTEGWLKITDMWINSSIVLMVLIIIAVVDKTRKKWVVKERHRVLMDRLQPILLSCCLSSSLLLHPWIQIKVWQDVCRLLFLKIKRRMNKLM